MEQRAESLEPVADIEATSGHERVRRGNCNKNSCNCRGGHCNFGRK